MNRPDRSRASRSRSARLASALTLVLGVPAAGGMAQAEAMQPSPTRTSSPTGSDWKIASTQYNEIRPATK
jgi:hypothetical protein